MNKIFKFFIYPIKFLILSLPSFSQEAKIKVGLLIPLTGDNSQIGKQILKASKTSFKRYK